MNTCMYNFHLTMYNLQVPVEYDTEHGISAVPLITYSYQE